MRRRRSLTGLGLALALLPVIALAAAIAALWLHAGPAWGARPGGRGSGRGHARAGRSTWHIMLASEHNSGGHGNFAYRGPMRGGGYAPFYGSYFMSLGYSPYAYGPYSLPPLFVPADTMFGPGQMMQGIGNLGADDFDGGVRPRRGLVVNGGAQGALGGAQGAGPGPAMANGDPPAKIKVRVTNAAAKVRAGKFLQAGDTQFGKQKFHQALERYREGSLAAPDLAECFFRQGFAQIAMGQYETANKMFRHGLLLKPNWAESDFDLVALYGADHHLTQLSHREGLAQAIEQNPLDSGMLIAMGMLLYFDGERPRSRVFFERAAQLGGNAEHTLDGFLAPAPADADADEKADAPAGGDRAAGRPAGRAKL